MLAGGGGLAALENHVATSYGEGVWWALSLMTTVGFVGEAPETTSGRVVSALLMVAGFAMMTVTTAAIASTFVHEEEEPERKVERDFEESIQHLLTAIVARLEAIEAATSPTASTAGSTTVPPAARRGADVQDDGQPASGGGGPPT